MNFAKRDEQLRQWIRAAPESQVLKYSEEVMWGVVFNLADETSAPEALFTTEEKARAYAELCDRQEWHVGPYVLESMLGRNSVDVPKGDA